MADIFGDTPGSLAGRQRGLDQLLLSDDEENQIVGDAGEITDNALGGDDSLMIGGNSLSNLLVGDSSTLSGRGQGGDDSLTGGDQTAVRSFNTEAGDAITMSGFARGGDDIVTGGHTFGSGLASNLLVGDAKNMSGGALGGNDTLIGGSSTGNLGHTGNGMVGDAEVMSDTAKGGNDVLVAGTAGPGSTVANSMWGDAKNMSGLAKGGADTFVFKDNGSMTVGTSNAIFDFSQSEHDKIEFIGVAGVESFDDLIIDPPTGGNTVIHAGADAVTLLGFTGTLTQQDFLIS